MAGETTVLRKISGWTIPKSAIIGVKPANNLTEGECFSAQPEKPVHLPGGATLEQGELRVRGGSLTIQPHTTVIVNGLKIENSGDNECALFFNRDEANNAGKFSTKNHIVIDLAAGVLAIRGTTAIKMPVITFLRNNPFVPIENSDEVCIKVNGSQSVLIENRSAAGLIPRITVQDTGTFESDGKVTIINGWPKITVTSSGEAQVDRDQNFRVASNDRKISGAPFEIRVKGRGGQDLKISLRSMGKVQEGGALILNNYGEIGVLDAGRSDGRVSPSGYAPFLATTSLVHNTKEYTIDDFHAMYPNIELTGEIDSQTIRQMIDYLATLPSSLVNVLAGIDLPSDQDWAYKNNDKVAAYATRDGVIHIKRDTCNLAHFQHEGAHVLTYYYENHSPGFLTGWNRISGNVYGGRDLPPGSSKETLPQTWADGSSGPRNGLVRPYGAIDVYEDIATFVEKYNEDPSFFNELIDPASQKYDARYAQKLGLLKTYGFIR